MLRYVVTSVASGMLFGFMDALIHVNSFARRLYAVYDPIAKTTVNAWAGVVIDLVYGFVMAGIFLLLYESLPGEAGVVKGVSFALLAWFFRVVMYGATQWMMFDVPGSLLLYTLVTGFGEMLVLGVLYGLVLRPSA